MEATDFATWINGYVTEHADRNFILSLSGSDLTNVVIAGLKEMGLLDKEQFEGYDDIYINLPSVTPSGTYPVQLVPFNIEDLPKELKE